MRDAQCRTSERPRGGEMRLGFEDWFTGRKETHGG